MFRKVRLRLTLLSAGIALLVLTFLSIGFLYVSEQSLRNNSFLSFQRDMNTLLANLSQQTSVSYEWIAAVQGENHYRIYLYDNGTPLLSNSLSSEQDEPENPYYAEALQYYQENYPLEQDVTAYPQLQHQETAYRTGDGKERFYVCKALIPKGNASLEMLTLLSLQSLERQIIRQRLLFVLIAVPGLLLLTLFAWFYTGLLLRPIRENQRRQTEFVAAASHELRTPLAVMLSSAGACRDAAGEERQKFLAIIDTEGRRMSRLIEDMLTLTASGRRTLRREPAELDTLLLTSYEAFQPLAREKGIQLSVTLPQETCPPYSCDKEQIAQALGILIQNALAYTPSGGLVELALTKKDRSFLLSVRDNGAGIPDEDKGRIFERFYRSERSRTKKGHYGLGLAIAAEITRAHRGKLTVSDTPGGGSTFTIRLS